MDNSARRLNGRHITIIVVSLSAAVVLAPVGVFAATHAGVSIVDSKHPSHTATVTKAGAQIVSGSVALKGTSKVTESPALPGIPYNVTVNPIGAVPTVPAGKHFVITNISGYADAGAGAKAQMGFEYGPHPAPNALTLPLNDMGDYGGFEFFGIEQQTYLILNPGDEMEVTGEATSGNITTILLNLSGYLV